jgi:methylmalonyl-CoA mutase N-terminal domain/subunit
LRTQQVIAYETDVCKTVDPFAGSYVMESMTDDVEASVLQLMQQVEDKGGAVAAIEQGFQKSEIERSAYRVQLEIDGGERTVVGLNKFTLEQEEPFELLRADPQIEADQCERLAVLRRERDHDAASRGLDALRAAAGGTDNLLLPMKEALAAHATGGEVAQALRDVWGTYVPNDAF